MQVYHGKSVFGGIAIGKISVFSKKEHKIVRVKINDTDCLLYTSCRLRQISIYIKVCLEKPIPIEKQDQKKEFMRFLI